MNVYDAINARRTVRDFKDQEIDFEIIKRILDAGVKAPTNNHMRQWEFIVINDKARRLEVINKIHKNTSKEDSINIVDDWKLVDQVQREMYIEAIPKQYQMLLSAGCLIIPCFQQSGPLLEPKNLSALNSFASIWCCIENILVAAASEGIMGVTRIPFDNEIEHIRTILNIPEDYYFPCYLALGYPDETAKPAIQHTVNITERIHFNKW